MASDSSQNRGPALTGPGRWHAPAVLLLGLVLLAAAPDATAGTSGGAGSLLVQNGSGAPLTRGDYVSAAAGLNAPYRFYIEVPPSAGRLEVEIFDPNVGGLHDQLVSSNAVTRYTLRRPTGGAVVDVPLPFGAGIDNAWDLLYAENNPTPGHWELVIDTASPVPGSTDSQGYGVRAHDGDETAGGVELNVYAESFINPGRAAAGSTTNGRFHPYVVSGCTATANDFDWDGAPSPSFEYSSYDPDPITPPGARYTSGALAGSANGAWGSHALGPWTTDESAEDYGIWSFGYSVDAPAAGDVNGNNTVVYVGDFNAAGTPPTAQPESNTFRIYLPTDAGGPPAKPQAGQGIVTVVSGADPPTNNADTVIRLGFVINNPTPHDITFQSPNHLVNVEVPSVIGNRVEYVGPAVPTQGTVLAQPAVGGTGTITWDPGTIVAGGWAQLDYDVVIRPQPANPRTILTGAPGASGSTATYIDETCTGASPACSGAQLARATHTLGPLCELAVTTGVSLATRAVVSGLRAYDSDGGVVVEWMTLSEHGTVGFHLERLDPATGAYERVNDRLLPGLLHSSHGGTYRYLDPVADAGELHTYRLIEVEADGNTLEYGPFPVIVSPRPPRARARVDSDTPIPGLERVAGTPAAAQSARRAARKAARLAARLARRQRRGTTVKIAVRDSGLHYLEASAIGEAMGLPTRRVRRLIRSGRLALWNRGAPIATVAAPGNVGLYFYGESVGAGIGANDPADRRDDLYTGENVYLLRRGSGVPMRSETRGLPSPVTGQRFRETVRSEGNKYTLTHLFDDPDGDYWMWDFRVGGLAFPDCATTAPGMPCYITEYPLASPAVAPGDDTATLTVRLHGGSQTTSELDHDVTVSLNGEPLGRARWDGTAAHTARFTFPAGLLEEAGNAVTIDAAPATDPGMLSIVYVNDLMLDYPRRFATSERALHVPGESGLTESVDGFATRDVWVLDVTDPRRPVRVTDARVDQGGSGYRVSFVTTPEPRRYLAVEPEAALAPASVIADTPSNLRARYHRVDHLIITTADMVDAAHRIADHRAARGLRTKVVALEDIYDEFNDGIANAEAIWRFLHHARAYWRVSPRYVLLAGEGSHDYRNYLGNDDAVVPSLLAPTPQGLFPSDNLYADVEGDDGLPEMAIGRLPVMNAEELLAVSRKIIDYENGGSDAWGQRALVAADAPDGAGEFPLDSEHIASVFPVDYDVERLHLDVIELNAARARLIQALNEGKSFMNFVGHGGSMALGNRGLMSIADIDALANGDRLPVVTAQTCLAGQFGFPGIDGIGEHLMLRSDRGAAAVWAPSGLSMNGEATLLGEAFYRSTFERGERVIGDAILEAQRDYAEAGGLPYLLDIYNLIGDPATEMK